MTHATDELPPWMLEEDDNINLSWDTMDTDDITTENWLGQLCQIRGTTPRGMPGILNGYYGVIESFKRDFFLVSMPQYQKMLWIPVKNVLVQTTVSQRVALMLPTGRFISAVKG